MSNSTHSIQAEHAHARSGFTLMEVTLAIAVVAVGVMALFALMSGGLDFSAEAVEDTNSATFANNVFHSLQSKSSMEAANDVTGWDAFWYRFKHRQTNVTVAAPMLWNRVRPLPGLGLPFRQVPLSIHGDGDRYSLKYINQSLHDSGTTNIVNHVIRYVIDVEFRDDIVYPSSLPPNMTNVAEVTLKVWADEFGSTNDSDAIIYYTEIDNPGDL